MVGNNGIEQSHAENDIGSSSSHSLDQDVKAGAFSQQECNEDAVSEHQSTSSPVYFTPKSKTSAYFTTIFSGAALFSDGYQSGIISFVQIPLKLIYGTDVFTATVATRISYSMFVGAVVGQLGFGVICDRIGRKIGLVSTTLLVIIGAAMCTASSGTTPEGLLWMLVISRGIMGVGVG
jgi:MFS family permease